MESNRSLIRHYISQGRSLSMKIAVGLQPSRRRRSYAPLIARLRDERNRRGALRQHRKTRRRLGDDPTRTIQSPSDAVEIADTLLAPLARQDANYSDVWASVAVIPVAELLYAASVQTGSGSGMQWASRALVNVEADETVPGWRQSATIWERAAPIPSQLRKIAEFPSRQRNSVIVIMHAAITLWLPGPRTSPQL